VLYDVFDVAADVGPPWRPLTTVCSVVPVATASDRELKRTTIVWCKWIDDCGQEVCGARLKLTTMHRCSACLDRSATLCCDELLLVTDHRGVVVLCGFECWMGTEK